MKKILKNEPITKAEEVKGVPDSMLGSLKGKIGRFTPAERKRIWRDKYRE